MLGLIANAPTPGSISSYKLKEIPAFCIDHINYEYKHNKKGIKIKLLDTLVNDKIEIDDLYIFKFPSNHSDDNLAVLDNKTHILFVGDALCGKIVEYDFIKDKNIIKKQIELLRELEFDVLIESHSFPTTKRGILQKLEKKYSEL